MLDRWTEILDTLLRHRLRTALTAFSVAWGIFVLVLLLGLGEGLSRGVAWQFRDDATNSIWIRPGQTSVPWQGHGIGRRVGFTNADYEALDALDAVEKLTGRYYLWGEGTIAYGDRRGAFDVRAVHPDHRYLENTQIVGGRYLNDLDVHDQRKVAVIGDEVAKYLFRGADPLGAWIDVNRIRYQVVGTFTDEGGSDETRMVYIPISTAQAAYGGGDRVDHLMFTLDPSTSADDAARVTDVARGILARSHHFAPTDRRALRIRNNLETWEKVQGILTALQAFTVLVGLGTMAAGVVGVSNILLVSVSERTAEFGLRKALGATPRVIVTQVLQEAVVLTGTAGWLGLVAGMLAVESFAWFAPEIDYLRDPSVHPGAAVGAVLVLVFAGTLAGFFPAWRAARISPVEALRG